MSEDDLDKFEEQEMKKRRLIMRKWFNRLIKQSVMGKKPKIKRDKLKDKRINDIGRLFETEKEKKDRKKKHNKNVIKDGIIRGIRALFEPRKEEDYLETKRLSNFWKNNYIRYESNSDKNRTLSLDEYLDKFNFYFRNMIIYLQSSGIWKIQLIIAINFISSKDSEEERVMHSSSDNIKFTTYSNANDVTENLFKSLPSKHQDS